MYIKTNAQSPVMYKFDSSSIHYLYSTCISTLSVHIPTCHRLGLPENGEEVANMTRKDMGITGEMSY
jgi:hypothetical protein